MSSVPFRDLLSHQGNFRANISDPAFDRALSKPLARWKKLAATREEFNVVNNSIKTVDYSALLWYLQYMYLPCALAMDITSFHKVKAIQITVLKLSRK